MSLFQKIRGTIETVFQIGIASTAILLKNVTGKVALRNKADSAYVPLQLKSIELFDSDESNKVTISYAASGTDITMVLPADDGSPSQVLSTDGSGNLSWVSAGTTDNCVKVNQKTLAFGTSSPFTLFTLPANACIHCIKIIVDTAFNGTAPTVTIGITGTTSKYTGTTDVDLKLAGMYEVDPGIVAAVSSEALIATYVADASSAGSARIQIQYSNPDL